MPKKAVVLLSGGLDSATVVAIAKNKGFDIYALTFDYGQRHKFEVEAAKKLAAHFEVKKHVLAKIDLTVFGGSALTDDIEVPKQKTEGIPITYVPARNTIFLSFALGWTEVLEANDIFIGVNALDYYGYPDCRPEFIEAYQNMVNVATKKTVEGEIIKIHTPLINLSKAEIIKRGLVLDVPYVLTLTCYNPNDVGQACGTCDACCLRQKGFAENNIVDTTIYR